jgi:phosphate transport system substrate-binding protein
VHSSGGIAAVRSGAAVLGRIARPLTLEERAEGITEVPVFRLPSAFIINAAANVRHLTSEQATRIFRGEITNWQDLGGTDLRIKIVRRDEADSTLKVLRATIPGWRSLVVTDRSKLAATTQEASDLVSEVPRRGLLCSIQPLARGEFGGAGARWTTRHGCRVSERSHDVIDLS